MNSNDYVELKKQKDGIVDLSIRTSTEAKSTIIITAKLNQENLDKMLAHLMLLKAEVKNEK